MAILNHIGIAVADLEGMKKLFALLDFDIEHVELVPEQGVKTHFLPLPPVQSHLELLEPIDSNGTIAQFLQKKGPGIHHLSFQVEKGQLNPLCEKLRGAGYRLTYDQPKPGAHAMRINFIHPSTAGGILIEIMEPG